MHGPTVDEQTRCVHYRTELDIVAIKFACCGRYYPCFECHAETESHEASVWPLAAQGGLGILCGVCRTELAIDVYRAADACPACGAAFNPRCRLHADRYFEV